MRIAITSLKSAVRSDDRQTWTRHSRTLCASYSRSSSDTSPAELLACEIGIDPTGSSLLLLAPPLRDASGRAPNCVVHHKDNDGANDSHQETVEIQSCDSTSTEHVEQPSSSDGSDDSENEVEDQPLTSLVDDLTANETRKQPQNDPS